MAFLRRLLTQAAAGLLVPGGALASPALAQEFPIDPARPNPSTTSQDEGLREVGRTAETAVGEVGQRKATANAALPMGRVNNRIQNRVQNRIRNRIDRSYDPRANATSPFEVAAERVGDIGLARSQ